MSQKYLSTGVCGWQVNQYNYLLYSLQFCWYKKILLTGACGDIFQVLISFFFISYNSTGVRGRLRHRAALLGGQGGRVAARDPTQRAGGLQCTGPAAVGRGLPVSGDQRQGEAGEEWSNVKVAEFHFLKCIILQKNLFFFLDTNAKKCINIVCLVSRRSSRRTKPRSGEGNAFIYFLDAFRFLLFQSRSFLSRSFRSLKFLGYNFFLLKIFSSKWVNDFCLLATELSPPPLY